MNGSCSASTASLTATFTPTTDMEKQIAAVLSASAAVETNNKTLTQAEQLALKGSNQ